MKVYAEDEQTLPLSIATSGANAVISAPGVGHYIAIDFIAMIPASAVTVLMKSGANNLTGTMSLAANQGLVFDNAAQIEKGVVTCRDNEAFSINLGGAVQTSGLIRYRIVGN